MAPTANMRISKVTREDNKLEMQIEEEDIAVADILHHEILKNRQVEFAGAVLTHPLVKKILLKVQTKGISPKEVILTSCKTACEEISEIIRETTKALGNKTNRTGG